MTFETGTVYLDSTIDDGVVENVNFNQSYDNPVVIVYQVENNGGQFVAPRAKNVTSNSADIFCEEPDNEGHAGNDHHYLVAEEGTHQIDGVKYEAGIHTTNNARESGGTDNVNFSQSFSSTPSVLHGLQTHNNNAFMASSVTGVSSSSVNIGQEQLETGKNPSTEEIAWFAIEQDPGGGSIDGNTFETHSENDGSNDGMDDSPHTFNFSANFSSSPDIIVSGQVVNGGDGFTPRGTGRASTSSHSVYAQEDQVSDSEQGHADEEFGYIAIDSNATVQAIRSPTTPTLNSISSSSNNITINWSSVTWNGDVGNYEIFRSTSSGSTESDYTKIDTVSSSNTSYTDNSLEYVTEYYYRIKASNSAGDSSLSNQLSVSTEVGPPEQPSLNNISVDNQNNISISWSAGSWNGDVGTFNIYSSESSGTSPSDYTLVQNVASSTTTFVDSSKPYVTEFYYRVESSNSAGTSALSNEKSIRTTAIPQDVAVNSTTASSIDISWSDIGQNYEYNIYRSQSQGSSFSDYTKIDTVQQPPFSNTSLENGEKYYYRVSSSAKFIQASGGSTVTDVTIDGKDYRIHAFENAGSSTFTVNNAPSSRTADILVIAGGGGGSGDGDGGGAGGAGGLVYATNVVLEERDYSVVVGNGGNGVNGGAGNNGEDSHFDEAGTLNLQAIGGGGGGSYKSDGKDGGSGGGAGTGDSGDPGGSGGTALQPGTNSLPTGTVVHDAGNKGGDNEYDANDNGAGGGGAGSAGEGIDFDNDVDSDGGDGLQINIDGVDKYYAGGGGGYNENNSVSNPGGLGGGGDGSHTGDGENGVDGLGGGGGGAGRGSVSGGDGGSGIVIVRYEI